MDTKPWGVNHPEYMEKIKQKISTLMRPSRRCDDYKVLSVIEKLVSVGPPGCSYDEGKPTWRFEGIIVSLPSCDEASPEFLTDVSNEEPSFRGNNRRTVLRVPIWWWNEQWEILDKDVSGYRREYGFPD